MAKPDIGAIQQGGTDIGAIQAVVSGGNTSNIPLGTLDLNGFAPTAQAPGINTANIPLGTLDLNGLAPTSTLPATTANIPLGTLDLNGNAPTAQVPAINTANIPVGTLDLTGFAIDAILTGSVTANIPVGTLDLTGYQVTVTSDDGGDTHDGFGGEKKKGKKRKERELTEYEIKALRKLFKKYKQARSQGEEVEPQVIKEIAKAPIDSFDNLLAKEKQEFKEIQAEGISLYRKQMLIKLVVIGEI